jgi:acetate kinase
MKLMVYSYKEGSNMAKQSTEQSKKKPPFVTVPFESEDEKIALRMVASSKNKCMAEYIRDLVRADLAQQAQTAGAGR